MKYVTQTKQERALLQVTQPRAQATELQQRIASVDHSDMSKANFFDDIELHLFLQLHCLGYSEKRGDDVQSRIPSIP